jgi:hypothetical protein
MGLVRAVGSQRRSQGWRSRDLFCSLYFDNMRVPFSLLGAAQLPLFSPSPHMAPPDALQPRDLVSA